MQVFFWSPLTTFFIDVILWIIIHFGIGYVCSTIPIQKINADQHFYQTHQWEKEGFIYQHLFKVRAWKKYIPQGSKLYRNSYSLQHINSFDIAYLERWLKESVRAEFCHWIMIIPGFFFLWNTLTGSIAILIYAFLTNLIPIILQRYNRPRIRQLLELVKNKQELYKTKESNAYKLSQGSKANQYCFDKEKINDTKKDFFDPDFGRGVWSSQGSLCNSECHDSDSWQ